MINLGDDYANIKGLQEGEFERLPVGGYVCLVLLATIGKTKTDKPQLILSLDIAEGEYAGFYKNADNYAPKLYQVIYTRENKISPFFKGLLENFEKSNGDFKVFGKNFDESQLNHKKIGVIFGEEEYFSKGVIKTTIKPVRTTTVENIRNGKFKIPELKKISIEKTADKEKFDDEFNSISDESLPF